MKIDELGRHHIAGTDFILVRHQWSKTDIGHSLHAAPSTFTTSGLQLPDFLAYLGFERLGCPFSGRGECYARWLDGLIDLGSFGQGFENAFGEFGRAEQHLDACGFFIRQLEGWGYFHGGRSQAAGRYSRECGGGAHEVSTSKVMKTAEDDAFRFVFTWVTTRDGEEGWTTHYRAKNPPLSSDLRSAFEFLGIDEFRECPEFDFEPCCFRFTPFESDNDMPPGNADVAHGWFDAHREHFSRGLESLLAAHRLMEAFGFKLLPFKDAAQRREDDIQQHIVRPETETRAAATQIGRDFDVALSFAGSERQSAEELATRLRAAGFRVFYDNFYPEELWGKDLIVFFDEIYRKRSHFCVMFISKEYADRMWTNHERRSAQARTLEEKGNEYILPVRVDGTELPGMPQTTGYVSTARYSIEQIAEMLIKKLRGT